MKIQMQEIITNGLIADATVEFQLDHERNEFYIDGFDFDLITDMDGEDIEERSLPHNLIAALEKKVKEIFDSNKFVDYCNDIWERAYGY